MDREARELLKQLQRLAREDSPTVLRLEVRSADGEYIGCVPLANEAALILTEDVQAIADYPGFSSRYALVGDEDAFDPEIEAVAAAVDALFVEPGDTELGHWDRELMQLANVPYVYGILNSRIGSVDPDADDELPLPEGTWDGKAFRPAGGQDGDL